MDGVSLRAPGSMAAQNALDTQSILAFCAGGVKIECLSTPTAFTPALTLATNCRHLSPGIWLRALTGESPDAGEHRREGGMDGGRDGRKGADLTRSVDFLVCITFE